MFFFTCIHVSQETGKAVWYSHVFQNFLQFVVIHTVKGFSVVSEVEVVFFFFFFFAFPFFIYDSMEGCNFISGSLAFSKFNLYIWKFLIHVPLKPNLNNFEHNLESMWNECSCTHCCTASSFFLDLFFWSSLVAYWMLTDLGCHLLVSYLFAFSCCSWDSRGKNTEVVCHSLLQWTRFC